MLSEPALQIVSRTTPRGIAVDAAIGVEHVHGRSRIRAVGRSSNSRAIPACQTAGAGGRQWRRTRDRDLFDDGARNEIDAAFSARKLLLYDCKHLMGPADALFQGTQARNPCADREESLGAAAREGRARHRRRRPDEGRRPHPWRLLRPFRFAGSAGDRGLCLCDGPLDRALAQARRADPAGKAACDHRGFLSDGGASRRSRPWLRRSDAGRGNRPRKPEDPQGVRRQAGADDRHAGRADSGCSAQGRAQAGDGGARDHDGNAGAGPDRRQWRVFRRDSRRRPRGRAGSRDAGKAGRRRNPRPKRLPRPPGIDRADGNRIRHWS